MLFTFYKRFSKANVGALVVLNILGRYWFRYLVIFLVSAAAFGFQVVGISTLVSCIRGTSNRYSQLLGTGSMGMISGFLFLVVAAFLLFAARYLSVLTMVEYEGYCASRLIQRVRNKYDNVKDLDNAAVLKLLSKDCRFGGRIAQEISGVVMPAGIAMAAFPALLYLNLQATLILFLIISITAFPYWFIAKIAKTVSYQFELAAGLDGKHKKETLQAFREGKWDKSPVSMPHPEFKKRYAHRLIIAHSGIMVGGIQMAVCLFTLSWWFSRQRLAGMEGANIVLYAFVAVLAFSQLKTLPKVFANFHVFLAYFQRAFVLIYDIKSIQVQPSSSETPKDEEDILLDLET